MNKYYADYYFCKIQLGIIKQYSDSCFSLPVAICAILNCFGESVTGAVSFPTVVKYTYFPVVGSTKPVSACLTSAELHHSRTAFITSVQVTPSQLLHPSFLTTHLTYSLLCSSHSVELIICPSCIYKSFHFIDFSI